MNTENAAENVAEIGTLRDLLIAIYEEDTAYTSDDFSFETNEDKVDNLLKKGSYRDIESSDPRPNIITFIAKGLTPAIRERVSKAFDPQVDGYMRRYDELKMQTAEIKNNDALLEAHIQTQQALKGVENATQKLADSVLVNAKMVNSRLSEIKGKISHSGWFSRLAGAFLIAASVYFAGEKVADAISEGNQLKAANNNGSLVIKPQAPALEK